MQGVQKMASDRSDAVLRNAHARTLSRASALGDHNMYCGEEQLPSRCEEAH